MYLLQLVQALKYENFDDIKNGLEPTKKDSQGSASENLSNSGISSAEIDRYGSPGKIVFTRDTWSLFKLSSSFIYIVVFFPFSLMCQTDSGFSHFDFDFGMETHQVNSRIHMHRLLETVLAFCLVREPSLKSAC